MRAAARRRGFTLLEICVVMFLAMMLMTIAIPSLTGMMAQRRLQAAFDRFDGVVIEAQRHSITEGREYVISWVNKGEVDVYPASWSEEQRRKKGPVLSESIDKDDAAFTIKRASLSPTGVSSEWTFWPTGTCEPAVIHCEGAAGAWEAAYNPLSTRAKMQLFVAR